MEKTNKQEAAHQIFSSTNKLFDSEEFSKMSASNSPFETCDLILNHVRSSCLNFAIQETPFSVYLTLRKSFSKSPRICSSTSKPGNLIASPLDTDLLETELEALRKEFKLLKLKSDNLEKANDNISRQFVEKK